MSRHFSILRTSLIGLLLPVALQAQTSGKASSNPDSNTKALELREQAVALYQQPKRAADAARLHIREAKYRRADDPEAVEALIMAAHMFNYAERWFDARYTMEQAGDRALSIGDVGRAAQAYLDAAFLARKVTQGSEMQRLVRKAFLLSQSPVLSFDQREQLRQRIKGEPTFANVVK